MGSPESLKMHRVPNILHDFFGGVGRVGSPKSLKMFDFDTFFYDFLVEWAAWKPRIIQNAWISMHCSGFLRWGGKRGKPRIIENVLFHTF